MKSPSHAFTVLLAASLVMSRKVNWGLASIFLLFPFQTLATVLHCSLIMNHVSSAHSCIQLARAERKSSTDGAQTIIITDPQAPINHEHYMSSGPLTSTCMSSVCVRWMRCNYGCYYYYYYFRLSSPSSKLFSSLFEVRREEMIHTEPFDYSTDPVWATYFL